MEQFNEECDKKCIVNDICSPLDRHHRSHPSRLEVQEDPEKTHK